jgi:hypothetical protein
MLKLIKTNPTGALKALKRRSRGKAAVCKTTAVAAALLASGFMSLPSAMASSETQVISGTKAEYSSGLLITSKTEDTSSQAGRYVIDSASVVTGENGLTIEAKDSATPPRIFQRSGN